MKCREKPTVRQQKMIQDAIAREYADCINQASRVAAYRMMLIVLYALRFNFGFKKRLNDFFEAVVSNNSSMGKLLDNDVAAAVYLKRLEESGCDFCGAFDELIEYEEEQYKKKRDKEAEIRGAKSGEKKQSASFS